MKKSILFITVVTAILILSCSSGKPGVACCRNENPVMGPDSLVIVYEPDSLIRAFLKDSICLIISDADYVVVKHVLQKPSIDTVRKDTSWYNVEDSVGLLSKKKTGFLHYFLLSDSSWNWSKIKIKHAFEPELVCVFYKNKSSVSVLISPASQEIGFGYTNNLLRKEYKEDRLIDNFIDRLRKMKKAESKKNFKK